eukprot:m.331467 g.331467  ORF g.331467 m.331467 type:complete len:477 (+) comp20478_c0_seq1:123-1553(+)
MGGASSTPEVPGGGYEGYHVLKVAPNSPGEAAGLEGFFDFILAVNDIRLEYDSNTLKVECEKNMDKPVKLTVYSTKNQDVRDVQLTPTQTWGGSGLLGVSIRFASFDGASENVWHILDVAPGSPAEKAQFIPQTDYIIAADSVLDDRDDLFALIERENGREVHFYVYNAITDTCRDVTVVPNDQWGGDGCLGCGIGYGYLHRIPSREDRELLIKKSATDGQTVLNMTTVPTGAPVVSTTTALVVPVTTVAASAANTAVPADVGVLASPSVDAFADVNTSRTTSTVTDMPSPPMPAQEQTPDYLQQPNTEPTTPQRLEEQQQQLQQQQLLLQQQQQQFQQQQQQLQQQQQQFQLQHGADGGVVAMTTQMATAATISGPGSTIPSYATPVDGIATSAPPISAHPAQPPRTVAGAGTVAYASPQLAGVVQGNAVQQNVATTHVGVVPAMHAPAGGAPTTTVPAYLTDRPVAVSHPPAAQ